MKFHVTKDDIKKGLRRSISGCPIARAIEAHGFTGPTVDGTHLNFRKAGAFYRVLTPRSASRFIRAFDKLRAVKPFTFEIKGIA